jgi:CheY-like chemotaxis protein
MTDVLARARPVLVMSTERAVRELLGHFLREEGYLTCAAADGDAAFAVIAEVRPLVAVLDMRRGEDDDLLFLGLLRKRHPGLGAIILLPQRSLVVHGRHEHLMDHEDDRGLNLPSVAQLRGAIEWLATQTMLVTWKPPEGLA